MASTGAPGADIGLWRTADLRIRHRSAFRVRLIGEFRNGGRICRRAELKLFFFLPSLFGILKNLLTFAAEQQNERHAKE